MRWNFEVSKNENLKIHSQRMIRFYWTSWFEIHPRFAQIWSFWGENLISRSQWKTIGILRISSFPRSKWAVGYPSFATSKFHCMTPKHTQPNYYHMSHKRNDLPNKVKRKLQFWALTFQGLHVSLFLHFSQPFLSCTLTRNQWQEIQNQYKSALNVKWGFIANSW